MEDVETSAPTIADMHKTHVCGTPMVSYMAISDIPRSGGGLRHTNLTAGLELPSLTRRLPPDNIAAHLPKNPALSELRVPVTILR
ncbi:MAG: hypothetical protein LAO31_15170 [Acidobacteriia bacterium]|nr:hypothetical protein [Terriglobia bacterium]